MVVLTSLFVIYLHMLYFLFLFKGFSPYCYNLCQFNQILTNKKKSGIQLRPPLMMCLSLTSGEIVHEKK